MPLRHQSQCNKSRRQNFIVQLGQSLQCRNGVFRLTVFCTKNCIRNRRFREVFIIQCRFMYLLNRIAGQIRLLGCGLCQKQEHALLLIFTTAGNHLVQSAQILIGFTQQQIAQPSHTLLCFTRLRLDFAPFLVNGFSLFKCV